MSNSVSTYLRDISNIFTCLLSSFRGQNTDVEDMTLESWNKVVLWEQTQPIPKSLLEIQMKTQESNSGFTH